MVTKSLSSKWGLCRAIGNEHARSGRSLETSITITISKFRLCKLPHSKYLSLCRGYDLPTDVCPTRIPIRYGAQHPAAPLGCLAEAHTWRAVLFGNIPVTWDWRWSSKSPVHFICHSQGGNSVRYLIELLKGTHTDLFPGAPSPTEDHQGRVPDSTSKDDQTWVPDFPTKNYQDWVASVVTIGTPHRGTTVTDVVQVRILPLRPVVGIRQADRPIRRDCFHLTSQSS